MRERGILMKKILVVLTNQSQYGDNPEATGLWLSEATEFVREVTKTGYEVDYVSPKGGYVPIDPRSLKPRYAKEEDMAFYRSEDFQKRALSESFAADQIHPEDYIAIYYAGGHGVVWDFPDNPTLQTISQTIYQEGGYITSVCHGVAGLLNLKDESGQYLIKGKTITGFTQMEEILSGKNKLVPFGTEKEAKKRGANFVQKLPFTAFATQDGRLITGQNPMSGAAVGKLLVENLQKQTN